MKKTYAKLPTIIGILLVLYSITMVIVSNFNAGILASFLLGIFFLVFNYLRKQMQRIKPKWLITLIKGTAIAIVIAVLAIASMLAWTGKHDTADFKEDAVIVLGAGIQGETVSPTLKNRLNKAIEYWKKNPKAKIIVSGGQGPQENIPEALAMKRYLVRQNIPENVILMEDQSTSTQENFRFSKKLLDDLLPEGYTITYITTDFHIYRAGKLAAIAGLNSTNYASDTEWHMLPVVYSREVLVLLKCWLFGY